MKSWILGVLLCLGASSVWASETLSPKRQHLIQALVASSEQIIWDDVGKPLMGQKAQAKRDQAQRILLKIAREGIHDPLNAQLLEQVEGGSWLIFAALMVDLSSPADFCLDYDEACRTLIADDQVPEDKGLDEDVQDNLFRQQWQALGFAPIRFGP